MNTPMEIEIMVIDINMNVQRNDGNQYNCFLYKYYSTTTFI